MPADLFEGGVVAGPRLQLQLQLQCLWNLDRKA